MRVTIVLALVLMMSATAVAARCPRDCKRLFVEQMKACKAVCPARKPGKACRAACGATRKANGKTCKASVGPTPPLCGLPPVITPSTLATTSTTTGSITTTTIGPTTITTTSTTGVPSTTSTTVAPTNCAVEPVGTPCDRDANMCTHDQCANGSCQLASTTLCLSPAPCYTSVACDPATGGCSSGGYVGDGKSCGGLATPAGICAAGTCHVGKDCLIGGIPYDAGAPHPEFACLACQCRVVANGPPATGGGSCAAPDYNTIQAAVDTASAGETVIICPGTYNLTATVTVPVDLTFVGSGRANTIIDGANGGSRVQLFNGGGATGGIDGGRHVTFRGLTFRNGLDGASLSLAAGGAIAATTVEVSDSTFTANTASLETEGGVGLDLAVGGAIAANGAVVRGCTFVDNVVQSEHAEIIGGGAIFADTIDVADSTFTNNRVVDNSTDLFGDGGGGGGAILGISVDVRDSTFSNNAATTRWWNDGGAISVGLASSSHLTIVRSTFADNTATGQGGAIFARADVSLVESTLVRNTAYHLDGGAVAMRADPFANSYRPTAMVDKSTFDGNVSRGGGAIAGYGVVLTNSTFTNNAASGEPAFPPPSAPCFGEFCGDLQHDVWCCHFGNGAGGAIAAVDNVTATNCTFAGNVGVTGTIHSGPANYSGSATATLTNTILVGPPGVPLCSSSGGTARFDLGGNFSSDVSCALSPSHANVSAAALALGPLADNGGPTPTVALSPGSIAIGAGTCALATDQRGQPRPGPGNATCDSGAYEVQASAGANCIVDADCASNVCDGVCKCPGSHLYTFVANEQPGFVWPGGTSTQSASPGCSVTVQNPNADVSLACGGGAPFSVLQVAGYSSCTGVGGEDGDGCQVTSCPLGQGSCCNRRPSCLGSAPGTATASFSVQCLP